LALHYLSQAKPARWSFEPTAVEVPGSCTIAGVPGRGIADILTTNGIAVNVQTPSRKPSGLAADHALQLATCAQLVPDASGETRVDPPVGTKDPQLAQIEHPPGEAGGRRTERVYPLGAEGIAGGLYLPNRDSNVCSRRYCAFADACEREFGGR
jgi:hypothetical protein